MFYKLQSQEKKGEARITPVFDLPIIPYEIIGRDSPLITNNQFKVVKKGKFYDILTFDKHFRNFAISQNVKNFLDKHSFSGWSCFPIDIIGISDKYYCFQQYGYIGPIVNNNIADISAEEFDPEAWDNNISEIEASSWDKTDFFIVENTLLRFCTEIAAEKLISQNFSNLGIEKINGYKLI